MSSATTSSQLNLLKRIWGDNLAERFYKKSPTWNDIKKKSDFFGEGRYVIVSIAPTAGGSATFADALAAQAPSVPLRFFVQHRKEYQIFSVQNDAIARSKDKKGAVVSILKDETGKAMYAHTRALSRRLHGNGGGSAFQLDLTTTLTGTTALMRDRSHALAVDKGMQIQFALDDGSAVSPAGLLNAGATLTIDAINRSVNPVSMTMSAALNTIVGITTSAYGFRRGDYAAAMTGIPGWHPVTAPTGGDSFFGVDRSTSDVVRNSGTRFVGSGGSREEALNEAMAEAAINGLDLDRVLVSARDFADLANEVGSQRVRSTAKDGAMGVSYITHLSAIGEVEIVAEPDMPDGYFRGIKLDNYSLDTAGDCAEWLSDGPGGLLTMTDDDAKQGRIGCYGNYVVKDPGNCLIGTW